MTYGEAERFVQTLEVILSKGTPEGDVFYCVLSGPRTPENWPLNWFVKPGRGDDVCLVLGDGATETMARAVAAERIAEAPAWHPEMGLREAERALYPDLSALDEEQC